MDDVMEYVWDFASDSVRDSVVDSLVYRHCDSVLYRVKGFVWDSICEDIWGPIMLPIKISIENKLEEVDD